MDSIRSSTTKSNTTNGYVPNEFQLQQLAKIQQMLPKTLIIINKGTFMNTSAAKEWLETGVLASSAGPSDDQRSPQQ